MERDIVRPKTRGSIVLGKLRSLVLIALPGLLCWSYFYTAPDLYQAHSKIQLLSLQEQFLPGGQNSSAGSGKVADIVSRGERGVNHLRSEAFSASLVETLQLPTDRATPFSQLLRKVGVAAGLLEPQTGSGTASTDFAESLTIHFDPRLRVMDITYLSPDPLEAAIVANAVVGSYLRYEEDHRNRKYDAAIARLEKDITALQNQRQSLLGEIERSDLLPARLEATAPAAETKKHLARRVALERKAAAQATMIEQMRARLKEAQTRRELDLLPPQTRILSRATLPEDPVKQHAALKAMAVSFGVALLIMLVAGVKGRRKARLDAISGQAMPDLPFDASLTPVPDRGNERDIGGGAGQRTTSPDTPMEPVAQQDHLSHHLISGKILRSDHKRIVLVAEEEDWNGYLAEIAVDCVEAGRSVLLLDLMKRDGSKVRFENSQKGPPAGASEPFLEGLSDFLDGRVKGEDILTPTDYDALRYIGVGHRDLTSEDFFASELHALLMALEEVYDILLINLGAHYGDEFALKSLALARDALACLHSSDVSGETATQLREVLVHFGYQACMIFPFDGQQSDDQDMLPEQQFAA